MDKQPDKERRFLGGFFFLGNKLGNVVAEVIVAGIRCFGSGIAQCKWCLLDMAA